jgi:superfamily II DNA helicase RecQ
MRAVDTQRQLESLVGAGARFRSVQQLAIEAIMHQKSPIVVVMGTGAGKSMAFMLPASCSTGVTVVVVLLVSLRGNLKDRCVQAGIDCVEWDSRKL